MMNVNLLINGDEAAASDDATFERINPVTGAPATRAAAATVADAERAADAAAAAFPAWAALGPGARRAVLMKAADLMQSKAAAFTELMIEEVGATAPWAGFNVHLASNMLREAAALTTQIDGQVIPSDKPGTLSMAMREPAGVVLGIAPWNAPVILGDARRRRAARLRQYRRAQGFRSLPRHASADRSGSCRSGPAERRHQRDHARRRRRAQAGRSPDRPSRGQAHQLHRLDSRVGRIIAQQAAKYLKPVLLELGGKAPLVVLDDADIDAAVSAAAFGAYMNQGQICISTERIIVDEAVADEFVAKLAAKAKTLKAGDPRTHVVLGPLFDCAAAERMDALIQDATSKGAVLACGGKRDGAVVEATLLDRVNSAMRIYAEESFGPVKSVIRVKSVDEAVRIANDTEYGLSAAIFSRDVMRAMAIAKRIESASATSTVRR